MYNPTHTFLPAFQTNNQLSNKKKKMSSITPFKPRAFIKRQIKKLRIGIKKEIEQESAYRVDFEVVLANPNNADSLKSSKWKEKFNRFIYNFDLEGMKKYHTKLIELENEILAEFMEDSGSINLITIPDNAEFTEDKGDEGTRNYADIMKQNFETRKSALWLVEELLPYKIAYNL
tara:strand:- start:1070 stop:1594 length:525 start_codon:yes stop_codon:yes gene_type:complete